MNEIERNFYDLQMTKFLLNQFQVLTNFEKVFRKFSGEKQDFRQYTNLSKHYDKKINDGSS